MNDPIFDIWSFFEPYFSKVIDMYGNRRPPSADRIKKFKRLNRLLCEGFKHLKSPDELDNPRLWREFQIHYAPKGKDSTRIFTQDLNMVLQLINKDGKIKHIKLKTGSRKFSSSRGIHVEKLLDFNTDDVKNLISTLRNAKERDFVLLFELIICTAMPLKYLLKMKLNDVKFDSILIRQQGIILSLLLEPARTNLLRHIISKNINGNEWIFNEMTYQKFSKWLKMQCRLAQISYIDPEKLFYYGRFLLIMAGIPAYQAMCLGSQNTFSPFTEGKINE